MKSIVLNVSGIKFPSAFKTIVTKVNSPDKESTIVLDALPHMEISLGSETASGLGIEKDSQVTIKPVKDSTDGSFTLEVGEKVKKASTKQATRGSSPLPGFSPTNNLR